MRTTVSAGVSILFAAWMVGCGSADSVNDGKNGESGGAASSAAGQAGASGTAGGDAASGSAGSGPASGGSAGGGSAGTSTGSGGAPGGSGGAPGGNGSNDLCSPGIACAGIDFCQDNCFTDDCCTLVCNCNGDDRLGCELYCT